MGSPTTIPTTPQPAPFGRFARKWISEKREGFWGCGPQNYDTTVLGMPSELVISVASRYMLENTRVVGMVRPHNPLLEVFYHGSVIFKIKYFIDRTKLLLDRRLLGPLGTNSGRFPVQFLPPNRRAGHKI